jgi:hypothetical protein
MSVASLDAQRPDASGAGADRRDGTVPGGPVAPEGKARSTQNALRHGLCVKTLVLGDYEDAAALAALRGALAARHLPRDAAEAHGVEELAFAAWRQRRLRTLEAEALARAGAAETDHEAPPTLPSLSTLIRYRARLDRDWRRASEELELLRLDRAVPPSPAQLRVAADLIKQAQGLAASEPAASPAPQSAGADRANETTPVGTNEPNRANEDEIGMNEPTPRNRTNDFRSGTDEPRHAVPSLLETRTNEPDLAPPPALNRHQRRRLAALARRGLRPAA